MPTRTAKADWQGNLRDGKGTVAFGGGAYSGAYTWHSRFEHGEGTNPEELIAAAHAACFAMALSGDLTTAHHAPTSIHAEAKVRVERVDNAWTIDRIDLIVEAEVPGISEEAFQKIAEGTKAHCPVSRALKAVAEVVLTAKLR